jgi:hypothetical protein
MRKVYLGGGLSAVVAVIIATIIATTGGGGGVGTLRCYGPGASCYTAAACTTTITSNVGSAINAASGGSVICLGSAGSPYPGITTGATKGTDVTVQAAPGASVTIDSLQVNAGSHLVFQDLTVATGAALYGATHTHLRFMTFGSASQVCASTTCHAGSVVPNADVTLEHDRFDNIQTGISEGRLEIEGVDSDNAPSGISIMYSHFGGTGLNGGSGGCSDGIGLHANAVGVAIGPGNEFDHMIQGGCAGINGAHVDPIESFVARDPVVIGNYFHDNGDGSGGLGWFSGAAGTALVTNNVFACPSSGNYPYPAALPGTPGAEFVHNVIAGPCQLELGKDNQCEDSTGATVRDNVWVQGNPGVHVGNLNSCSPPPDGVFTESHNLNCGCGGGTGDTNGTPSFVGGSTPTTWEGWALASGSASSGAASDGSNMGIVP